MILEPQKGCALSGKKALDKELCDKLVQSASLTIGHNVLITDETGYVLSCNDNLREGTLHEASIEVVESGRKAYHDNSAAKRLRGTRPGMTIPLFVDTSVIGTVGITGSPQEISRYALLIQQMSQIFLAFQVQQQSSAQMDYRKQSLLRSIVASGNRTPHSSAVYDNAYEIGIDLNAPRVVILIEASTGGRDDHASEDPTLFRERAMTGLTQLFDGARDFVCPQSDAEYVVMALLPEGGVEEVMQNCQQLGEEMLREGLRPRIGVGSPANSLETLRLSYQNASFAVRVLQTQIRDTPCLSFDDVILEKLAAHLPGDICRETENDCFRSVMQSKNCEEIMRIVEHWCRLRFHFEGTAAALHIHKSTLAYRFRRIRELYDLDLYDFDRVMALYLLIVRRKLD